MLLCDEWRNSNHMTSRINFVDDIVQEFKEDKYVTFHITPYNTIEFRMKENLNNTKEIVEWIKLTHQVVENIKNRILNEYNETRKGTQELLNTMEKKIITSKEKAREYIDRINLARNFAEGLINE